MASLCNLHQWHTAGKLPVDEHLFAVEFPPVRRRTAAGGAAEMDALGLPARQRLLRALAYEVPLDLGGETERERKHLALDIITKAISVLDGPHTAPFFHTQVEDVHNHKHRPSQSGKFRADDKITIIDATEKLAECPLTVSIFSIILSAAILASSSD